MFPTFWKVDYGEHPKKNWARSDINTGNRLSLSQKHVNYGQKRQKSIFLLEKAYKPQLFLDKLVSRQGL